MPVFNLTLPRAVKALLAKYPIAQLHPGDVLITNDQWLCAGHLFDVAVVTPVFRDGRLVALMGTVGHVGDIGGTKDSLHAREIYEEGIQIPPMKLYRAGVLNEDLVTLIAENVPKSEEVLGDIHSFVAANAMGAERLLAFMSDYGMHDLRALAAVVQNRAEQAMRVAIRALPDGDYVSEAWNNPLGQKLRYPLKLTVSGDAIALDFGRAAATAAGRAELHLQLHRRARHLPAEMHPQPPGAGQCRLLPAFHRDRPAGVGAELHAPGRGEPAHAHWMVHRAQRVPRAGRGRARGGAGGHRPASRHQHLRPRRVRAMYSDHFFVGGGQGASAGADGKSALLWPTSGANTSVELMESRAPVLVLEKSLVPDSGGPDRFRGGLGVRTRLRKLYDDGLPMLDHYRPGCAAAVTEIAGALGGIELVEQLADRLPERIDGSGSG